MVFSTLSRPHHRQNASFLDMGTRQSLQLELECQEEGIMVESSTVRVKSSHGRLLLEKGAKMLPMAKRPYKQRFVFLYLYIFQLLRRSG